MPAEPKSARANFARLTIARIAKTLSFLLIALFLANLPRAEATTGDGVVLVKSGYAMDETIRRIKDDIASKKIMFFDQIDQAKLAAGAGITLRPSTLLIFGNPPLGTQFLTSNPVSGLDWPVRILVFQDKDGTVWAA